MFNSNMPSLSDIAAVSGNRNNGGFGDGNGWWVLIILFAIFGGWGNNGLNNGNGGNPGYVGTAATQADIQRGFDTQSIMTKLNGLENGLCDGFYAMNTGILTGTNTLQNSVQQGNFSLQNAIQQGNFSLQNAIQQDTVANMQNTNALASQLASCCCENREAIAQVRYDMATNTCAITNTLNQIGQNIMQNCNANYRQLHDEIVAIQIASKDEKIAEQAAIIQSLNLTASQQAQNAYLIQQLRGNTGCCNANIGCGN